jgi:hypothetical protein
MQVVTEDSRSKINRIFIKIRENLKRFEIDRAVFFGLLTRIWGLCAGPVTAILIAIHFTPAIQGYYYTFATILALQVFVELGLGTVIVQFASHEWSKLNLDGSGHIVGDRDALSRLVSIAKIAINWYLLGGIIVSIGLGMGGYIFFSTSPANETVNWVAPWFLLSLATGISISLVPVWSLLEGCNQVSSLYTFRFFQGVISGIIVWIAILFGYELWTASIACVTALLCSIFFLKRHYWIFLKMLFLEKPTGPRIKWRTDMLPMQWRIALSWISGYFCFSLFTPVLFKYHGPIVAGQMGMTWSLIAAIGAISGAWLSPRIPQFGMLIAQKKYADLDRLFWRITSIVGFTSICVSFFVWLAVYFLNIVDYPLAVRFAERLLPPLPTALFLIAQLLLIVSIPFSSYLRAHKQEPIMVLSVSAAVMIGFSTMILGKYYSALGISIGYLVINAIIVPFVLLVWVRCRMKWHGYS